MGFFIFRIYQKLIRTPIKSVTMCRDAQVSREAGKPGATSPWGRQIKKARFCGFF
jgi:hypothetical protein